MIPVITKEKMRALDAHMIEEMHIPSIVLMENAAHGITSVICEKFSADTRIVALCGAGNNGGDGFAAARQLMAKGYDVSVFLVGKRANLKGDAAANAAFFGGDIAEIEDEAQAAAHFTSLSGCVVIDALFGTGLARNVEGLFAAVIELLNSSGAYVVGCDIPSGIDANTGQVLGTAVRADETVTFQHPKPGLLLFPGREYTGCLTVKEIGIGGGFNLGRTAWADKLTLPARPANAHKGTFGKLACVVSGEGTAGAGLMCAGGALRAGAGLTTAAVPAGLQHIFNTRIPECMTFALSETDGQLGEYAVSGLDKLMDNKTALAAGCGLGTGDGAQSAIRKLVADYDVRKVFDADALTVIAGNTSMLHERSGEIVLTPHLVEFSRLCGRSVEEISTDMMSTARQFAGEYGVTLLLKGATTIVTDGSRTTLVTAGTPGMAKGGSGDVLTGVIGGLLAGAHAYGLDTFGCAVYGAYICGKAGELAAEKQGEYAMTATDTLDNIGAAMKRMTK